MAQQLDPDAALRLAWAGIPDGPQHLVLHTRPRAPGWWFAADRDCWELVAAPGGAMVARVYATAVANLGVADTNAQLARLGFPPLPPGVGAAPYTDVPGEEHDMAQLPEGSQVNLRPPGCDTARCRYPFGSHASTCHPPGFRGGAVPPMSEAQRMAAFGPCPRCHAARDATLYEETGTGERALTLACPNGCDQGEAGRIALVADEAAELLAATPGGPTGPLGDFARATVRAADMETLDQALGALRAVADALGIFPATWTAHSLAEVGTMLVAEIARRDTLGGPTVTYGGVGGTASAGGGGGQGSTWAVGMSNLQQPRTSPQRQPTLDAMVAAWRATADAEQAKAGELPPSQGEVIARLRGSATAWYTAANFLADATGHTLERSTDDDNALD